jgi:3-hydroxyisobutyrate dehydrogenase-like beta-hydroxyacid dehydrogenase
LVCVNLFSEQQLDEVFVEHGVLADIQPGSILAIHSTVSPNFIRGLAQRRRDIDALDAGFSGGPDEASAGKLTLMVGGDAAVLERARPVFATYAQPIVHAGALGTGMTLKVINNLLFAANIALAADALHLVQASGVGLEAALAALMHGSAGSNALGILGRSGHPAAAMAAITRYLEKDVPIALESARGLDLGRLAAATGAFQKADLA